MVCCSSFIWRLLCSFTLYLSISFIVSKFSIIHGLNDSYLATSLSNIHIMALMLLLVHCFYKLWATKFLILILTSEFMDTPTCMCPLPPPWTLPTSTCYPYLVSLPQSLCDLRVACAFIMLVWLLGGSMIFGEKVWCILHENDVVRIQQEDLACKCKFVNYTFICR